MDRHPVGQSDTAPRLTGTSRVVSHPAVVGTLCGEVCRCRRNWRLPDRVTQVLLASSVGHVLPSIARTATALGLTVSTAPGLLEVVDPRDGRGLDRLFHRLARELTGAETEAVRVATDPPAGGADLAARLLGAPSLAVE